MQEQQDPAEDLTVIIVSYNTAHLLDRLFDTLFLSGQSLSMQVIVVDNASRDNSVDILRGRYPQVEVIVNTQNVGFGRANNQALEFARGRYVLLLNTDAFVSHDTLSKTLAYMAAHPNCGILGVRLTGEDGHVQPSCRYFPTPLNIFVKAHGLEPWFPRMRLVDDPNWDPSEFRECDWVPGCYYLTRKELINQVGLFDPRYFLYYEEVDHCQAARAAGWSIMYYPDTTVIHVGGESAESVSVLASATRQISVLQVESELLYFRKHRGVQGALLAGVLGLVSDMVVAAKALIKAKSWAQAAAAIHQAMSRLSLMAQTRLGSRPTR